MNSFAAFGNNQMKFSFFLILLYYVNIPCTKRKNLNTKKKIKISLLNIRFCTLNHVCVCDFFGFTFFLPVHNNKKKQSRDVIYLLHNLYNNKMINFNCLIDQKEFFVVMNCHFHY